MQITHSVLLQISQDATGNKKLFWIEDQPPVSVQITSYANQADGIINITAGAPFPVQQLGFGTVQTVGGIYLEVNQDVTLNLNGTLNTGTGVITGGLSLPIKRGNPGLGNLAKFFAEMNATSAIIQGTTGQTVQGLYCVWGDVAV